MYPTVSIVDPDLIKTLPKYIIASRGLDALTHAVEAFLSIIDEDPNELNNLSGKTEFKEIEEVLLAKVNKRWNTKKMTAHIIQNQQQRGFVHKALSKGTHTGWDYVPAPDTFTSYRPKVQNYYGWFGNKV